MAARHKDGYGYSSKQTLIRGGIVLCLILLSLVFFDYGKDFREHELDEHTFRRNTIDTIQKESGISLPAGCKGLKYHYIPPIDPIIFAKIEIPLEAARQMEKQISALTNSDSNFQHKLFPNDVANDRCHWWPTNLQNVIVSKKVLNGYFIEAHLVREQEQVILYLKYFTI